MIDLCIYLERKVNGEWQGTDLDDVDPELSAALIGWHSLFSLFGSKHGKGYDHYPTFPFIQLLPLTTEESFAACTFKEKYNNDKLIDIYKNLQKYDTCETFAIYFDDEMDRVYGMFTIDDALKFNYRTIAYDNKTWDELLGHEFFELLLYARQYYYDRIVFYFT